MADNDAKIVIGADVNGAMGGINRVIGAMPGLSSAIAGGFSIAAITAFVSASINAADELNDLSQKTGIAVETLAGFKLAAEQNGTTIEGVAQGVKKLSTYMVEHGDKLKKAGIDAKTADGALLQLSDVFAKMTDPVQRSALATELFGKAGTDLIPMLSQGSAALGEMIAKGQQLNPITTEMAKQADAFNDSMTELKAASAGAGTALANSLLPALNAVISRLNEGIQATGSLIGGINALAYGSMGDDTLRKRIADYEGGNEGGILLDQYEGMKREITRRQNERSAAIVASLGPIDSREGRGRSTDGAGIASANAAAAGLLAGKGPKAGKSPKERGGFQMSAEESALLDEWSADAIRQDMADAVAALAERDAQIATFVQTQREQRLADIDAEMMTASEREQIAFATRMAFLQSAQQAERDLHVGNLEEQQRIDDEFKARREDAELKHQAALGSITAQMALQRRNFDAMTAQQQREMVLSQMGQLIAGAAQSSRAFFTMHKIASIAQTVINTHAAAMNAYKWASTWGGPGAGAVAAGVAIAAGAVQIAAIQRQQFGGGGGSVSAPSGGGGNFSTGGTFEPPPNTPAPVAIAAAPTTERRVVLLGDFADSMVETLRPMLEDGWINGAGNMRLVLERSQ